MQFNSIRKFLLVYIFPMMALKVPKQTRVEAGSNTCTVNLRVVRGDEMGLKRPRHSLSG
jgi:hypothetical protein